MSARKAIGSRRLVRRNAHTRFLERTPALFRPLFLAGDRVVAPDVERFLVLLERLDIGAVQYCMPRDRWTSTRLGCRRSLRLDRGASDARNRLDGTALRFKPLAHTAGVVTPPRASDTGSAGKFLYPADME
jgi:hypothetical protein